jgi:hypothetical protein
MEFMYTQLLEEDGGIVNIRRKEIERNMVIILK